MVDLVEGQTSRGIRVVDFAGTDAGWELTVEGEAGRTYELRLAGQAVQVEAGGTSIRRAGPPMNILEVTFPGGEGRATRVIELTPAG